MREVAGSSFSREPRPLPAQVSRGRNQEICCVERGAASTQEVGFRALVVPSQEVGGLSPRLQSIPGRNPEVEPAVFVRPVRHPARTANDRVPRTCRCDRGWRRLLRARRGVQVVSHEPFGTAQCSNPSPSSFLEPLARNVSIAGSSRRMVRYASANRGARKSMPTHGVAPWPSGFAPKRWPSSTAPV